MVAPATGQFRTLCFDNLTGEIRRVAIFVAVMGASNYTYVEACEGQDMMSWLNAHCRCLTFLGGVPKLLIPDNLRSAVKKADRYEPAEEPLLYRS